MIFLFLWSGQFWHSTEFRYFFAFPAVPDNTPRGFSHRRYILLSERHHHTFPDWNILPQTLLRNGSRQLYKILQIPPHSSTKTFPKSRKSDQIYHEYKRKNPLQISGNILRISSRSKGFSDNDIPYVPLPGWYMLPAETVLRHIPEREPFRYVSRTDLQHNIHTIRHQL